MTNREWLESFSDEKLGKWISDIWVLGNSCEHCILYNDERCTTVERCEKGIANWLQAEHKED